MLIIGLPLETARSKEKCTVPAGEACSKGRPSKSLVKSNNHTTCLAQSHCAPVVELVTPAP